MLLQPALVAALVEGISNSVPQPVVAGAARCWAAGSCCWDAAPRFLVCLFTREHVPFLL